MTQRKAWESPGPGDVFRHYTYAPEGRYHVLEAEQQSLPLPGPLDLHHAIGAELVLEVGNAHLGWEEMAVRVNDGPWHPIPFPDASPRTPSPALYFHQWNARVPIPLSELHQELANTFELSIGPKTFDGRVPHPAYTCIYSVTLRIQYDPALKPHASGTISAQTVAPETLRLTCDTDRPARVDFVGLYEGINSQGDAVYRQWQYRLERGRLAWNIGQGTGPHAAFDWDTTWIPDQLEPISVTAWITDESGVISVAAATEGIALPRSGASVELCKPYDVDEGFTSCQYGVYIHEGPRQEKFDIAGDLIKAVAARFAMSCWNGPAGHGLSVNGVPLTDSIPQGEEYNANHALFVMDLKPISALKSGVNTLATIPGPARSSDIHWPGVAVLMRYDN